MRINFCDLSLPYLAFHPRLTHPDLDFSAACSRSKPETMTENVQSTRLTASCHCKANQYTFSVPTTSLPLPAYLCHCNISRRISGSLFTSYVAVPAANAPPDLRNLTAYKSSNILTRWFCTTCSTHLFLEYSADGAWWTSTGTLDRSNGIVSFKGNMWIGDTIDGGASDWIRQLDDRTAERWLTEPQTSAAVPLGWHAPPATSSAPSQPALLPARCHCGGVRFTIARPSAAATPPQPPPPFPDLTHPRAAHPDRSNAANAPWWQPGGGARYLAGHCACASCRLIAGHDVAQWAFVPTAAIALPGGAPFPADERAWGSMRAYRSSEGITRRFCGVCGASLFWDGEERPQLVDVAVGVLDAESGARAEEWLVWWTGRVSYAEEALNRVLVESLERGLKEWAKRERAETETEGKKE